MSVCLCHRYQIGPWEWELLDTLTGALERIHVEDYIAQAYYSLHILTGFPDVV